MKYITIKRALLLLFSLCCFLVANAETIKTDVLVIGGTAGGTAAAIQSARSKLKTLLIESGPQFGSWTMTGQQVTIGGNKDLPAGIWAAYRKKVNKFYSEVKGQDTTANKPLIFEPYTGLSILKKITDTVKNLTVKLNTNLVTVKKDGTGWDVVIKKGEEQTTVKAHVLIDATPAAVVAKMPGLLAPVNAGHISGLVKLTLDDINQPYDQPTILYKTSIAICEPAEKVDGKILPPFSIPLGALIVKGTDNLIIAGTAISIDAKLTDAISDPAIQFGIGQGAGVIAAYCAFYKTTTKNLSVKSVRAIQGELLDFKGYIIPFADITPTDINARAIQQIGATGLLKGKRMTDEKTKDIYIAFESDTLVRTAEIESGFTETYTRAFLWFDRVKPNGYFTVGNLLSFISEISLHDPKTFQLEMQKQWQTVYRFKSTFDLNKPLTRREFAVLTNKFLNPFARYVDITGRLIN